MLSLVVILGAITLGSFAMLHIIAADRTRYLARFDLSSLSERHYLAMLPNFLQYLHDAGFTSPWPRRLDAVSALVFRLRLRRILKAHPPPRKFRIVDQHLALHALLTILKPYIDDAILVSQSALVRDRLPSMADTRERDRLITFVARAREVHIAFHASLCKFDRVILQDMRDRHFTATLEAANAIFHEHGYDFLPALDTLRNWATLDPAEIAHELPALPKAARAADITLAPLPDTEAA